MASASGSRTAEATQFLLAVIELSASDFDFIRVSARLAEALSAPWIVINVQTSSLSFAPDRLRKRRLELMHLAESLGAEAATLHGASPVLTIANYARLRGVTKILLRSPDRLGWRAVRLSFRLAALQRAAPQSEILYIAIRPGQAAPLPPPLLWLPDRAEPPIKRMRRYLLALGVTTLFTLCAYPLAGRVDLINIVMLYLLGAAISGLILGRGPSALTAVSNILAFDYFFVPPVFSLMVIDQSYLVTFAAMLLVGLIIAHLMVTVRERTDAAGSREQHTAALYAITRELAAESDTAAMFAAAARHIAQVLQARAQAILSGQDGLIDGDLSWANPEAAQAAVAQGQRVGAGTPHFAAEPAQYLPLRGSRNIVGVLIVQPLASAHPLLSEQQSLLEAMTNQLALALERVRLAEDAHAAHLAAERAAMRNTLLASISHDLRTPLSAIAGAGSIVAQHDFTLDLYRRITLGRLIEDKAKDMSDLLGNVLELVRLESGPEVLHRDWHYLNEVVSIAIARQESRLAGWNVLTDVPEDLPPVFVDSHLLAQVLSNLLENAVKYTPPGTRIYIGAKREDRIIRLIVEDTGPGLGTDAQEKLFETYVRGEVKADSGGFGLGLAICRIITRLHGGDIQAQRGRCGGARFDISIPYTEETCTEELPSSIV